MLNKNINSKTAGIILGIFLIGAIFLVGEEYLSTKNEINGLTQARLQHELDLSEYIRDKSAISKWETGKHVPPAEIIEALEDILIPNSKGLLLKAAGYLYQVIDSNQEQSSQSKEIQTTALIIASNLEKIHNAPSDAMGDPFGDTVYTIGDYIYKGQWVGDDRTKLEEVNIEASIELLKYLKKEKKAFPELANIKEWSDLNYNHITGNFIQRLKARAHRGHFQ